MRITKIIDLSLPIDANTQVYPGDPLVRFRPAATIVQDGFNLLAIQMGSQSGTNCDAPLHFLDTGTPIDEVDLSLFLGTGIILDLRGFPPRTRISSSDIAADLSRIEPGSIVILQTGWSQYYGTSRYFDHPFLGVEACQAILDRGARTICLDTLNIDETPSDIYPTVEFLCHRLIAAAGGIVVENLTGVDQIDFPRPLISVIPLRLTGADGSPTRAVAIRLE